MKKIPGFYALFTAVLMALSAASYVDAANDATWNVDGDDGSYYVNMSINTTDVLDITDADLVNGKNVFKVYDDRGKTGDYTPNSDSYLDITVPSGYVIRLQGSMLAAHKFIDNISVFDGNNPVLEEAGNLSSGQSYKINGIVSTGNEMTIWFHAGSHTGGTFDGLDLAVSVIKIEDSHDIAVASSVANGSVVVDKESAKVGELVTLTATPDEGYLLASVKVVDSDGDAIHVTRQGNMATFVMPEKSVAVTSTISKKTFNGGCLSDNWYFHIECDDRSHVCTLSQVWTENPGYYDQACWYTEVEDCWDDVDGNVVCNGSHVEGMKELIQNNITYGNNANYTFALGSDLDLGGYDSNTGKCAIEFAPFETYMTRNSIEFEGNGHVIDGLCQTNTMQFGFFYPESKSLTVSNVTFKNVHIVGPTVMGAGTIAGYAGGNVSINNVKVKNAVVDAGVYVGGLVGSATGSIDIQNSSFGTSSSDAVSGRGPMAVIGGLVGNAQSPDIKIEASYVVANVSNVSTVTTNNGTSTLNSVGGIVGKVETPATGGDVSVVIKNTYSIGDITSVTSTAGTDVLGYIIGNMESGVSSAPEISVNYHFGEDAVKLGVGGGSFTETSWAKGSTRVYANVRSANEKLSETGPMGLHEYRESCSSVTYTDYFAAASYASNYEPTSPVKNGIATKTDMKSDMFAALLNKNTEYGDVWSRVDTENSELPMLYGAFYPNSVVVIGLEYVLGNALDADEMQSFGFSDYLYPYCADVPQNTDPTMAIVAYTDAGGHLNENVVNTAESLVEHFKSAGTDAHYRTNGSAVALTTSTTFLEPTDITLSTTRKYAVTYKYCPSGGVAEICYDFDDSHSPSLLFFSKQETEIGNDASAAFKLIPRVYDLTNSMDLAYKVYFYDANGNKITDSGWPSNYQREQHESSFKTLIDYFTSVYYSVKTIELRYSDVTTSAYYFSFEISNKSSDNYTYNVYGINSNGFLDETPVESAMVDEVFRDDVLYGAAINIKYPEKAGYSYGGYSIALTLYPACRDDVRTLPAVETDEKTILTNDDLLAIQNYGSCWRKTWNVSNLTGDDIIDLANIKVANKSLNVSFALEASYTLIDYTVSFDLSPFDSKTVVLGGDWVASRTGINVESLEKFPRVYVLKTEDNVYSLAEWGSAMAQVSSNADRSDHLTSMMLSEINPTSSKITVYPLVSTTTSAVAKLRVVAYDEDGNELTGNTDYHGNVVLSQVVGAGIDDLTQVSSLCDISAGAANSAYNHCLYLPKADDMLTFNVSLEPKTGYAMTLTGFSFDWIDPTTGIASEPPAGFGYDATTGKLVIAPAYMANQDMTLGVKYTAGPFYVTYDLNSDPMYNSDLYFPVDAVPSETLAYDATHTRKSLWEPYRADDVCFDGWSASTKKTYMFKALPADSAAILLSMDPDAPTELTANWSSCTKSLQNPITIANGSTKSSVKLIQKYGTGEFDHWLTNDIVLPNNSGIGYKFFVDKANSAASFGYTLGDAVLELDLNGNRAQMEMKGDSMVVGTTNESNFLVSFETTPVPLNFTFHVNSTDTVFYGNDWMSEVDGAMLGSAGPVWPQHIARLNACFTGWSATGKNTDVGYADLNSNGAAGMLSISPFDMVEMDDGTGQLVSKPVYRMYAMWDENCQNGRPATYKLSTNVAEVVGSFKVYQVVGTDTIARIVSAGSPIAQLKSDDYEFYIDFVPSPLYNLTSNFDMSATYSSDTDPDVLTESVSTGSPYVFLSLANSPAGATEVTLNASGFGVNPLRFVLDVNADSVFYGMGFYEFESEFVDGDALPGDIYRTEYEHVGWSFENGKTTVTQPANLVYQAQTHEFFNDAMVQEYGMYYKTYGRYPDTLFAVWTAIKDPQVNVVVNKSVDKASFRLYREIDGRKIEFLVSDSLKVPATRGFEFNVETIYDSREWTIDGKFPITLVDAKNDTIGKVEDFFMVDESVNLFANLKPANTSIRVALDENSKDSVLFGSDWTDELTSVNTDSIMKLPTIVYNSEKCLAGWTTDPKSDELLTVIDSVLLSKLRAKGKNQGVDVRELLYAKWTTNLDSCAGKFLKLAVEQENGSVWFAEGNKDKTVERRFTDEGTMFVPMELNGRNLRVQAMGADTSVYVLDSLVVLRNGKVDRVLHEGDYMPDILDNVTLKAYFGWKNKTKLDFAKARLDSTGSMFQLSFTASDFEVRRKVSAKVQVIDVVKDSIVTQSVFGDSVAMGFDTTFVFRMKKPGNYRMIVTLEDKTGVKEKFSREFSIDPVISSIAVDSWQMLSLSAVDMPSITWDGDQIFYWWDERGTGEFWQYKQLAENDSMDATRGVWYNSLEGRPLPLRDEIDDEGEDFVWKLDSVSSGWNLVANPHGWKVELFANYPNAVKDIDKNPDVAFWSWNTTTGQYDPMPTEIGPYEAVWVHVAKKTKWKMSAVPVFKPETKAVEKSRVLAKATTKDRWTLQAVLSDEKGKRDSWNILGAGLNPLATEEPPESMADHVNLSIMEGKRALAKSIKEASNEMEWTIALSASSDRIGYLSFEGVDGIRDYGYRVFVTIDGNTTEMQNGVPIKVYLKSTAKTATVRVAPAARVVAQNTLKGLRMARLGNQLRVSFEASEGLAGTNARVDILDMKGHVMATASAKALEGSNALVLDAPQTGLYMLRVRAGSQQQATKIVVQ